MNNEFDRDALARIFHLNIPILKYLDQFEIYFVDDQLMRLACCINKSSSTNQYEDVFIHVIYKFVTNDIWNNKFLNDRSLSIL